MTAIIKPSQLQHQWLCLIHSLAILAVFSANLNYFFQILAAICLLISGYYYRQSHQAAQILAVIHYDHHATWTIQQQTQTSQIEIAPQTIINAYFILLYYRQLHGENKLKSLLCVKDSMPAASYNAFRICLKINGLNKTRQNT